MLQIPSAYQFTPKDLSGLSLEYRRTYIRKTAAALTVSFSGDFERVPADRVWLIDTFTWRGIGPAGQLPAGVNIIENNEAGADVGLFHVDMIPNAVIGTLDGRSYRKAFMLGPGRRLVGDMYFTASALTNQASWYWGGWLIPRANIQLAGNEAAIT